LISAGAPSAGGPYSAPPDPLTGFKGPTSKGRKGKRGGGEGKVKGMEEREGMSGFFPEPIWQP